MSSQGIKNELAEMHRSGLCTHAEYQQACQLIDADKLIIAPSLSDSYAAECVLEMVRENLSDSTMAQIDEFLTNLPKSH